MTQVLPRVYIDPPNVEPYRFGLLGAAQPLTDADGHWRIGGVEWESLASYVAATYPAGIFAPTDVGGRHVKALPDALPVGSAWPFAVYAGVDCGSIGHDPAYVEQRARAILALARPHAIESQLWTGGGLLNTSGLNANNGATVLTGTQAAPVAVSLTAAVSRLEKWLGDKYSGQGLLHAQRGVAPYADQRRLCHLDRNNEDALVSAVGSRWVFGGGYDGTGPNAQAITATTTWLYATGQVLIAADDAITPADFGAALNRTTNREFLIAEQLHMVGIDGPWAAALVDFTL